MAKSFCFQCRNSVYRAVNMTTNPEIRRSGKVCLYCYKHKHYYLKDKPIGDCPDADV